MFISEKTSEILKNKIESSKHDIYCKGLFLSARWIIAAKTAKNNLNLIVLPNSESAEYCAADLYNIINEDIVFFLPSSGKSIEKSNYKATLCVQRTSAIRKILENGSEKQLFIVSYPEAISEGVPGKTRMDNSSLKLDIRSEISHDELAEKLVDIGFERVDFVSSPGQFSIRGSIVDVFSYSNNEAYRLSFFGDEVEKIHIFDCNTQLSKEKVESIEIVSDAICDSDEENILNLLPADSTIWLDSSDMYKDESFFPLTSSFQRVFTDTPVGVDADNAVRFSITPQPVFNKNFELLTSDIRSRIENNYTVFIVGEKDTQLGRVKAILEKEQCPMPEFICGKNLHAGFVDEENKVCVYTDHEIFDRFHRVNIRRSVEKTEQLTLNDLNSFNVGDYVVHIDHGVGVFGGLIRTKDDKGRSKEVVKIIYKDGDIVLVSVHALHKISRFRSKDGIPPKINKLGSKTWAATKSNAKKKVKDIAKELIQLYAKRRAADGFAFSPDTYLQDELESSFIYEDTPDQEETVKAVKRDMEDGSPMDRLVCGDVGFGKTEIAVRAAFKAVSDGKQVAVLVPTTILALQHYKTFSSRLQGFPCNVDYVSRLRTAKEISEIKRRLANGRIDIIVGTHKLLSKDFEFKDLGLLVIDEEQKFGVSAKEKLRQLKENIDTLTLTATPIPRTLQFSLLGARDLSIINTPPSNRIPIQTEIMLFDEKQIRSIIDYELKRGGQIFFLHNRVEELQSIADILQRLEPDMRICTVHGQMESKQLEDKMIDFMAGEYDLLLCTTIIENGLDIPNANTIIINQAQNIGLSDLHQLRGRVGRSNRRAFCYLIVPPLTSITDEARRRLKAIEEFSDLGSGFNIAMQDLDIRGAGNLFGAEQSGFISEMGLETYQKILFEAMEELGVETGQSISTVQGKQKFTVECTVDTDQPALFPDSYLDITSEKIRIYKQIDSISSEKEADRYAATIRDRFGDFPAEVQNLFDVVKVRNLGAELGFEKVIVKNGMLICFFVANQMSPYYKSDTFAKVIEKAGSTSSGFALKQVDGRLKIVTRGIGGMGAALQTLKKLR